MYDIYMFFNFNLNNYMLYNGIITCICPLIQKFPNISVASYYIHTKHTFFIELYNVTHSLAARCDTQPTHRHPSLCTFTQFAWCWPFRSPHQFRHFCVFEQYWNVSSVIEYKITHCAASLMAYCTWCKNMGQWLIIMRCIRNMFIFVRGCDIR